MKIITKLKNETVLSKYIYTDDYRHVYYIALPSHGISYVADEDNAITGIVKAFVAVYEHKGYSEIPGMHVMEFSGIEAR